MSLGPTSKKGRFLFLCQPGGRGHLNPLIGIAQHLLRKGHHVGWLATSDNRAKELAGLGVEVVRARVSAPLDLLKDDRFFTDEAVAEAAFRKVYLGPIDAMLDGGRLDIRAFAPDVMVVDAHTYWGQIAGQLEGIPTLGVGFSTLGVATDAPPFSFARVMARFDGERDALFRRHGVEPMFSLIEALSPDANVNMFPPELPLAARTVPASPSTFVGPPSFLAPAGDEVENFPYRELETSKPLVYLALGSAFGRLAPQVFPIAAEAASTLGVKLIIAAGSDAAANELRAKNLPGDVFVCGFAPQLRILERADLFITHGGANSFSEALRHGLPLLIIPIIGDQPVTGYIAERAGVGLHLPLEELSVERCRDSLKRLLGSPGYRSAARALAPAFQRDGSSLAAEIAVGLMGKKRAPRT